MAAFARFVLLHFIVNQYYASERFDGGGRSVTQFFV